MNILTALTLAVSMLNFLATFFEGKDANSFGNDDRAARIIRFAASELQEYIAELQSEDGKLPQ